MNDAAAPYLAPCSICGQHKPATDYTPSQYQKAATLRKCKVCMEGMGHVSVPANRGRCANCNATNYVTDQYRCPLCGARYYCNHACAAAAEPAHRARCERIRTIRYQVTVAVHDRDTAVDALSNARNMLYRLIDGLDGDQL
jgi:hypothetical protein